VNVLDNHTLEDFLPRAPELKELLQVSVARPLGR
jgi:hypothetical protein